MVDVPAAVGNQHLAKAPMQRMSAPVYFACVAAVTAIGFGIVMLLRPDFAYRVQDMLGLVDPPAATHDSFFTVRVAPLFETHCIGCHGERRQKGKLRLDSFAASMRGGRNGPVIEPNDVTGSELIKRLLLPPTDERAMPPPGKTPMAADEITVVKLWVAAGASGVLPVGEIKDAPKPVAKVVFPEVDEAALAKQRQELEPLLAPLRASYPGVIDYTSRGSTDVEVNASLSGATFDDGDLAKLAPLRSNIVRADFSGTSISDASAAELAAMTRLRVLRLANTKVTDVTIVALSQLQSLQSLTTVGTSVTAESLAPFRKKSIAVHDGRDSNKEP